MYDILIVILLIILGIATWLFVPAWIIKRNTHKVIKIFRKKNADRHSECQDRVRTGAEPAIPCQETDESARLQTQGAGIPDSTQCSVI